MSESGAGDWESLYTADGVPYYHNSVTGEVQWEAPEGMQEEDEGDWLWVEHPEEAFTPARIIQALSAGKSRVETRSGEVLTVSDSALGQPIAKLSMLRQVPNDLVQLEEVSDATVVYALRQRYLQDKIYTSIGDILVAVNPFKQLPLYAPLMMREYMSRDPRDLAPHVYGIAASAFNALLQDGKDQAILISGESGAGKTESTKQCLAFLSEVAGSASGVERKILASNPILESFGNAKTTRNNNSSRFGKFMELYFAPSGKIIGCDIVNYLLEKSRINHPGPQERSYHFFYQLCLAATDPHAGAPVRPRRGRRGKGGDSSRAEMPDVGALDLGSADDFASLTRGSCTSVAAVDDAAEYAATITAMHDLGFLPAERQDICAACAAVLHLGNVGFVDKSIDGAEGSEISQGQQHLSTAARLIGVDETELAQRLRTRELTIRGETSIIQLDAGKASDARDALASAIYRSLFDWLVMRVNRGMMESSGAGTLDQVKGSEHRIIGILDIFGFEIFETNSFEQLCINFCNEKLQQHFNSHTFKTEEETYRSENVPFEPVPYIDNQDVLDLIEKKPLGVLPLLDEEVKLPRTTDLTFLRKLNEHHAHKNPRFDTPKGEVGRTAFAVLHYAGPVAYCVDNFLDKNKDQLSDDVVTMLKQSRSDFVRDQLFASMTTSEGNSRNRVTQGGKFRNQLNSLMGTLNSASPHYIRCIKPNQEKQPRKFHGTSSYAQLRCSGVFEAVTIRKCGYPFRLTHENFFKRFRILLRNKYPRPEAPNYTQAAQQLRADLAAMPGLQRCTEMQMGRTMLLWRNKEDRPLSAQFALLQNEMAKVVQRQAKCFLAKSLKRQLRAIIPTLLAATRTDNLETIDAALDASGALLFQVKEHYVLEKHRRRIVESERVKKLLEELQHRSAESIDDEFEEACDLAREFEIDTPAARACFAKFEEVRDKREAIKALREVVDKDFITLEELEGALGFARSLKAKYGDFCPEEESIAAEVLDALREEYQISQELVEQLSAGTLVHGGAGDGSEASFVSPPPPVAALKAAVAKGNELDFRSPAGSATLQFSCVLLDLRAEFIAVVDRCATGAGSSGVLDDPWEKVRALVSEVSSSMELPDGAAESGRAIGIDLEAVKVSLLAESAAVVRCADEQLRVQRICAPQLHVRSIDDGGAAIQKCIGQIDALHSAFLPTLCAPARQRLGHVLECLTVEKDLRERTQAALASGFPFGVDVGEIKAAQVEHEPLREVMAAFAGITEFFLAGSADLRTVGEYTANLREVLAQALVQGELPREERDFVKMKASWEVVETALIASNDLANLEVFNAEETEVCKELLLRGSVVEEIVEKMKVATEGLMEGELAYATEQAHKLGLESHPDEEIRTAFAIARDTLEKLSRCRRDLRAAIEQPKRSVHGLRVAITQAEQLGFERTAEGAELVDDVKGIQAIVAHLSDVAHAAWQTADHAEVKRVAAQCREYKFVSDDAVLCCELADVEPKRFLQKMLRLMKFLGRNEAATDVTVAISDLFFESAGALFDLKMCPILRNRDDYGRSASAFHRLDEELAENMLRFSDELIPTSLTLLRKDGQRLSGSEERELIKFSIAAFECILGYMGDRACSYPPMLAQELLRIASLNEALVDEIFCQLMKQLTGNPDSASYEKGIDLMAIIVRALAPSSSVVNYLEAFLRSIHERRLVRVMHLTSSASAGDTVTAGMLSLEDIGKLQGAAIFTGWMKLKVKGRIYDSFVRFFFVLDGHVLRAFTDETKVSQDPKGVIDVSTLVECISRYSEDDEDMFMFDLVMDNGTLTLSAESSPARAEWIRNIKTAKKTYWDTTMI